MDTTHLRPSLAFLSILFVIALVGGGLGVLPARALPAEPYLVKDINAISQAGSSPSGLVERAGEALLHGRRPRPRPGIVESATAPTRARRC